MERLDALRALCLFLIVVMMALVVNFAFFDFLPQWQDYNAAKSFLINNCTMQGFDPGIYEGGIP